MKKFIAGILVGSTITLTGAVFADEGLQKVEAYLRPTLPITLNGEQVKLDSAPVMYDGSTYLKLRDVANLTGLNVNWNDNTQTVELGSSKEGAKLSSSSVAPKEPKEETYEGLRAVTVNGETYFSLRDYSVKNEPYGWGFDGATNTFFYAEYVKDSGEIVRKIKEVKKDEDNASYIYNGETYLNVKYFPKSK